MVDQLSCGVARRVRNPSGYRCPSGCGGGDGGRGRCDKGEREREREAPADRGQLNHNTVTALANYSNEYKHDKQTV